MRSIVETYWDSKLPIYEITLSKLQKEGIDSLLIDVDGTLINRKSTFFVFLSHYRFFVLEFI